MDSLNYSTEHYCHKCESILNAKQATDTRYIKQNWVNMLFPKAAGKDYWLKIIDNACSTTALKINYRNIDLLMPDISYTYTYTKLKKIAGNMYYICTKIMNHNL